jgi:tRNA(fMet)-specific endonuclease VapC
MALVVVDTDVLSFVFKGGTRAARYRPHLAGQTWALSFMTVAELERWALARNWGQTRRDRMEQQLRQFAICFADRELCRFWADATESASRNGHPVGCADAWTAAAALLFQVPLITHNADDYRGVERLQVITEPDSS